MIKLTSYSHGAGCGCKISPALLDRILAQSDQLPADNPKLLVGNHSRDDAAVFDLGNEEALISTTDFFMPIVDDPFQFGRIAAANSISDVYAMGGRPLLAIAILGWPVDVLAPEIAGQVVDGGRSICQEAGIPLAGGHSIDSPEPIFGLAVNGIVRLSQLKRNDTAGSGDLLFLTKGLGVGLLTTAEKKGLLEPGDREIAASQMMRLNNVGTALASLDAVTAMTDVTGFGFLGHLCEMASGSRLSAEISLEQVPLIVPHIKRYMDAGAIPGGTGRNWSSYGGKISVDSHLDTSYAKNLLADPQTSGGLLIAVRPSGVAALKDILQQHELDLFTEPVGQMTDQGDFTVYVQ